MNCPLTKEAFCEAIDKIEYYWRSVSILEASFEVVFEHGPMVDIVDNYVDTLCIVMKDDPSEEIGNISGCPWIMYFCWDLDFGNMYEEESCCINGEFFQLDTPEKLYDLLVKLYWEESEIK